MTKLLTLALLLQTAQFVSTWIAAQPTASQWSAGHGIGAHPDSLKDLEATGTILSAPTSTVFAIFPYPAPAWNYDTRCVIVLARGSNEGWLIDRVARTVTTFTHNPKAYAGGAPKWCDEKGKRK
jgi:hypothetical protein